MDILLLFDYLPRELRNLMYKLPVSFRQRGEEIRLRVMRPVTVHMDGKSFFVSAEGTLSENAGITVSREMLDSCFESFTKMSPYAFSDELAEGFVTVEGGHRIGICGRKSGRVMRDISSVNIRIAREVKGCSDSVFEKLLPFENTLVISPPGAGKTTLLRDIARRLSDSGIRVSVADERCEIGAVFKGVPQHDVGMNTDILSGFSVYEAVMILLRTMSPGVIVTDEIGSDKDCEAVCEMTKSGVKVLASAHGTGREDVMKRYSKLCSMFEKFVVIENKGGIRNAVLDN